ncbi:hypothetical protein [Neolewinella agarilytica]|uniref:Uncharacterized protein n=1 Tax=Neolewinella agarilytica TaxID=478744 RepID=A0A1H9IZJ9_9BACT|nr:hypothetical protein [Neolewinella agarilytica]SEQ80023.1 hypothetical protein SAMN05444359_11624 [Neolewinella agarilytica]
MIPFTSGRFFMVLCCAVVVMWFASCKKEPIGSLVPPGFDGEAVYTMNGEMRTSPALASHDRSLPCNIYINASDLSFGQPQAQLIISHINFCELVLGDTLQVVLNEDMQEPDLPRGTYTVWNGGDLLAAIYSPAASSTIQDNYVVITAYDEATGLVNASFKLDLRKGFGNDDDYPQTLAIEGELEAIL